MTTLQDRVLCPDGHPNPAKAKFCGICGKKLEIYQLQPKAEEPKPALSKKEFAVLGIGNTGFRIISALTGILSPEVQSISYMLLDTELPKGSEKTSPYIFKVGLDTGGTGHLWKVGERIVAEDLAVSELVKQQSLSSAEAILLVCSLGGGMGSGAGPYMMSMFPTWGIKASRLALAVLPSRDESYQLHFNAYCGLSRLIRYRLKQNCDFIILVDNTNLEFYRAVDRSGRELSSQEILAMILHMIMLPGDGEIYRRITVSDLVTYERATKIVHFTPCLALAHSLRIYGSLTAVLDSAFQHALSTFDPDKALFSYLILRISKSIGDKMRYEDLLGQCDRWRKERLPNNYISYFGLSIMEDLTDKVDALLLIGGYPLEPELKRLKEAYLRVKESSTISPSELEAVDATYDDYEYNLKSVQQSAIRRGGL